MQFPISVPHMALKISAMRIEQTVHLRQGFDSDTSIFMNYITSRETVEQSMKNIVFSQLGRNRIGQPDIAVKEIE